MRRLGLRKIILGIVTFLGLCAALSILLPGIGQNAPPSRLTAAEVTRVVDGDTLKVRINGQQEVQTIRIIGVDTPETKDPNREVMCYGDEATAKTQELVDHAGGKVELEKDTSETDRYGRLLRYVWISNSDGRTMLNEELVKGGYARAVVYPPDVRYRERFSAEEERAKRQHLGLWGACSFFGAPA
ncbi:thermonuclease family protein [Nitrolancea hollandica]|uniref:Micrococcal nuclease n=1 Tax=Nitrolancea hollandica Lb TaxID=1129897 RepID=I4EN41_9BACT